MLASHVAHAAVLCIVVAASAAAQDSTSCHCRRRAERTPSELELRSAGSITLIQTRPMEDLGRNIDFGYGANGAYLFRLDRAGYLSLRADLGIANYGNESKRVPLSSTIGGRIQVRVSTNNYIVPMSLGPQLAWPRGPVRPYVNAGIGGQAFFTESHVDGTSDEHDFASTTNQSDFASTWVAGGGVYVPLVQRKTKVMLDMGVQYAAGGRARYLRPGSIVDLPDAQISVTPMESTTHVLTVRVGVRVGL